MRYGSVPNSNPNGRQPEAFRTNWLANGGTLELSTPPIALTGSTSDPYTDRCALGAGATSLPPGPGVRSTPNPRDDGRVIDAVGFSPLEPGARSTRSPREDGRVDATVVVLPPEPGVQNTCSPREDGLKARID